MNYERYAHLGLWLWREKQVKNDNDKIHPRLTLAVAHHHTLHTAQPAVAGLQTVGHQEFIRFE